MSENLEDIVVCSACGNPMSLAGLPPYSRIACPTCGAENRIKQQFGPYTITRRHAHGGMSSVFVGIDTTLNREVALKVLSETYSKDERRIAAFEDEARLTASFSHPNVVKVLTTGRAFGLFYIAMEFVPGGHLEQRIHERGKLAEAEVLPLAIQIAEGLKGAQTAGLIHRDIKPGNILFDAEGHAKIVDFGLALVTKGGEAKADEIWATPYYVPPEAIEGEVEDFRSDIYAFGATLYHALAGVPSCTEDTMDTKLLRIAKTKVIPLKRLAPEVSYETCAIVDRAMSYDPKNRFTSYDEMISALHGAIQMLENGGRRGSGPSSQVHSQSRMRMRARQRRLLMIGLPVAVAILSAIGLVMVFSGPNGNQEVSKIVSSGYAGTFNTDTDREVAIRYDSARELLKSGKYRESEEAFTRLFLDQDVEEPTRSWSGLDAMIAALLDGRMRDANRQAMAVREHMHLRSKHIPAEFSSIMLPALDGVLRTEFQDIGKMNFKSGIDEHLLACLILGIKHWEQGGLDQAVPYFERIVHEIGENDQSPLAWYRPFAVNYLGDHEVLKCEAMNTTPATPDRCRTVIDDLNQKLSQLKTKGRAPFNIRSRQEELSRHARYLETLLGGN